MTTQNLNQVTEEEKKDDTRYQELNKKDDRNEDENKELGELKERYGKRMQKKIDKMTYETKTEREAREKAEQDLEDANARITELEKPKDEELKLDETTVEIEGKKYYTDDALISMVKAGKYSEAEAYKYQRKKDKVELKAELKADNVKESKEKESLDIRKKDAEGVLEKYPHFDKKHKDFNSEDPLYKLTIELYSEGLSSNPKGLSKSIQRAKQILRIEDKNIDRSDDLNLDTSELPLKTPKGEKEVVLSDYEKEAAVRMFCRGDYMNPKTGRAYTENEAHAKALEAKKGRK